MNNQNNNEFYELCLKHLKPGMVFNNGYAGICRAVGVNPTGGKTKAGRMDKLGELFNYEKVKNKITLLELKEGANEYVTKSKESKRNTQYADNIQNCLLYTLNKSENEKLILSIGRALKLCNMINDNFIEARKDVDLASEALDINKLYIYSFFNTEQKKMKANFEKSLNIMKNKSLIEYNKVMMVYRKSVSVLKNELNRPSLADNGNIRYVSSDNYEIATDDERRLIARIQKEVLNEMSFDNKKDAFLGGKWKVYKEEVDKRLLQRGNILYFFEAYDIVYSRDFIEHEVKKMELELSLTELNTKVLKSCARSAVTAHNKALKDGASSPLMYGDYIKSKDDYIEKYNQLANILIKENPEINLKEKMYEIIESKTKCSVVEDAEKNERSRIAQLEYDLPF